MLSEKSGVLAAIDQALNLVNCEAVRALLRTLINMLVGQDTSNTIRLAAKDGWLVLDGQRFEYCHCTGDESSIGWPQSESDTGLLIDALMDRTIYRAILPDGKVFSVHEVLYDENQRLKRRDIGISDPPGYNLDDLSREVGRLQRKIDDLIIENRRLDSNSEALRAKVYPHGWTNLRTALARLVLSWYFRHEKQLPNQYTTNWWEDQIERITGRKPLNDEASDAACAVKARFDALAKELGL